MTPIVVAFGSNLGEREQNIAKAISLLSTLMTVDRVSHSYETAPMYVEDQPRFLNGVVSGQTALGPIALVKGLKEIEQEVGRLERVRNGPREIDLDLVLFGSLVMTSRTDVPVTVPHPRLEERRFVLEPLAELDPDAVVPQKGSVAALLQRDDVQSQSVRRVEDASVPVQSAR